MSFAASAGMVLLNKVALSSFGFNCPNALLLFQCSLCGLMVQISGLLGFVRLEPWNTNIVKIWFPVNVIFVGMIGTSFYSLRDLGVRHAQPFKHPPLPACGTICSDTYSAQAQERRPSCLQSPCPSVNACCMTADVWLCL